MSDDVSATIEQGVNRPLQVSWAVSLYVVTLILGAVNSVLLWRYLASIATTTFTITVQVGAVCHPKLGEIPFGVTCRVFDKSHSDGVPDSRTGPAIHRPRSYLVQARIAVA